MPEKVTRDKRIAMLAVLLGVLASGVPEVAAAFDIRIVDRDGSPVGNAVVTVETVSTVGHGDGEPAIPRIEQTGQQFSPRVTAIRRGTPVRFPNRDITQHHVYSFSPARTFEIELYRGESPEPIVFDQPGIVALGCNIHDWMLGFVYVTDDDRFAVSDSEGRVSFDLDPGAIASLEVWHPALAGGPNRLEPADWRNRTSLRIDLPFSLAEHDPLYFEIDPLQVLFREPVQ